MQRNGKQNLASAFNSRASTRERHQLLARATFLSTKIDQPGFQLQPHTAYISPVYRCMSSASCGWGEDPGAPVCTGCTWGEQGEKKQYIPPPSGPVHQTHASPSLREPSRATFLRRLIAVGYGSCQLSCRKKAGKGSLNLDI